MIARELHQFSRDMLPVWLLFGWTALLLGVATVNDWRVERRRRKPTWRDVERAVQDGLFVVEEDLPDGPDPEWPTMYQCGVSGCRMTHETSAGANFCLYTRGLKQHKEAASV